MLGWDSGMARMFLFGISPYRRRWQLCVGMTCIFVALSNITFAQVTNSWTAGTSGKWETPGNWDQGAPNIAQSAVLISNLITKTVTIDSFTAAIYPDTLTISNLIVAAPLDVTNTLFLNNIDTNVLHIVDGLMVGADDPPNAGIGLSLLISTNSTLLVGGVMGGPLAIHDGIMEIVGGTLSVTNSTLSVAASDSSVGRLILSNGLVQAQGVVIGGAFHADGTIEITGGTMTLSSSLRLGIDVRSSGHLAITGDGLFVITNASTFVGYDSECDGDITISNATMLADDLWVGYGVRCFGALTVEDGTLTLSGPLLVGNFTSGGTVSLNGGLIVVTNAATSIATFQAEASTMTIEDGLFLAREILICPDGNSDGTLTINDGSVDLSSYLQVGSGTQGDARVLINGGQLIVTNDAITVGTASINTALVAVSGGLLAAKSIDLGVGIPDDAAGTLTVNGDACVTVSTGITLGDCALSVAGFVDMDDGQLTVTNATGSGFIDVRDGQLTLNGGTLQVDQLVMTNTCGSFVHYGGTLIVGSVILDPNAFRITAVTPQGNDILITWMMGPGSTNALQAASCGTNGSYTTNGFTNIFVVTGNTTPGTITNYLDVGGVTNRPARYYRARLAP